MRLAFVVPGFRADAQDWCIPAHTQLIHALAAEHDVVVLALRYPHRRAVYRLGRVTVYSFNGVGRHGITSAWLWQETIAVIAREHRRAPFDVIHSLFGGEAGFVAVLAGQWLRTPSVVWLVNGELVGLRDVPYGADLSWRQRLMNAYLLRFADRILGGCKAVTCAARARAPASRRGRIETLPLGVDTRLFHPRARATEREQSPHFLNVGSLVPVKDQTTLLRAFALASVVLPAARLTIAGTGFLEAALRAQAEALGIAAQVYFAGEVAYTQIPYLYRSADVFVQASRHEGQGMALLEAGASGCALVGTNVGALADLAPQGAAIAVPVNSPEILAQAMIGAYHERDSLARRAREIIEREYNLERVCQKLVELASRRDIPPEGPYGATAPENRSMSSQLPTSEWLSKTLEAGIRVALACVLFTSPWMIQWLDVKRRTANIYSGYTDFFFYPSDLFILLSIALWLVTTLVARRRVWRGPWYLTFPLAALVGLSFVSALGSVDTELTLYHSLRFLMFGLLYVTLVNTPLQAKWIVAPLAFAVLIQGGVAILQFWKQSSIGLPAFGELALDPKQTGISILRYDNVRILRAYGLAEHPNLLGGFLAFALIFLLSYYLDSWRGRTRYALLIPLGVGALALLYTFSRSAQLALVIGALLPIVSPLRDRVRRGAHLRDLAICAALLLALLIGPVVNNQRLIAQRLGGWNSFLENVGEVRSLVERNELIESANRVFYRRQLLGVGNGALPLAMYLLDKQFPKNVYDYQPAHLVILDVAAELGVLGGFIWLWLMAAPLAVIWLNRHRLVNHVWLTAVGGAMIVLLVAGLFDYYPWLWQAGRIWQWTAWGLFAATFSSRGVND